jgi:single-stranded DNA-specific DHH superfamily exonuclease
LVNGLADIEKAIDTILNAMCNNVSILLETNYDTDGIKSAVTLVKFITSIIGYNKENVRLIINRRKHGNGFNQVLIKNIIDMHSK